jgi:hypothetical protein
VQVVVLERVGEQRAARFGGVAVALVVGVEEEADLALPVLADRQRDVADQLARRAQLDGEVRARLRRPRDLRRQHVADLGLGARLPVEPARDVLARLDRVERREVLRHHPPEPQALGLDQRSPRAS